MSSEPVRSPVLSTTPPPDGEHLERTVRADRQLLLTDRMRFIWKIASPAYLAFYFLDTIVASGDALTLFLSIRIGVVSFVTLLVIGAKTNWGKRNIEFLSATMIFSAFSHSSDQSVLRSPLPKPRGLGRCFAWCRCAVTSCCGTGVVVSQRQMGSCTLDGRNTGVAAAV